MLKLKLYTGWLNHVKGRVYKKLLKLITQAHRYTESKKAITYYIKRKV